MNGRGLRIQIQWRRREVMKEESGERNTRERKSEMDSGHVSEKYDYPRNG